MVLYLCNKKHTDSFTQYRLGFCYFAWLSLVIGLYVSQWTVNKIWDVSDYVKEDALMSEMHSILWENYEDYSITAFGAK